MAGSGFAAELAELLADYSGRPTPLYRARRLEDALGGRPVDLVLSDMAPNMSGMAAIDQAKAMYLAELALEFAREHLRPGGDFLIKLFQGVDFDAFVREVRTLFESVLVRKPKASRPRSREVYLLARGRRLK